METSSPPRNGASHHLDPHRATVFGTRGVGGWSGGARGQVPPPSGALRATQLRATGSAPARAPERPPARLPASPPRALPRARPSPRSPAPQPRVRARPAHTRGRPPGSYPSAVVAHHHLPALAVHGSPWRAAARPGLLPPPHGPALGPSLRPSRKSPPGSRAEREGAEEKASGDWQPRRPMRLDRRGHALPPRSASGATQGVRGGASVPGVSGPRARPRRL